MGERLSGWEASNMKMTLEEWGYEDKSDYFILGAGIYGLICTIINTFSTIYIAITFFYLTSEGIAAIIFSYIIYIVIIFFPKVAKIVYNRISKKLPNSFLLMPVKTIYDAKAFVIFIGFWSSLCLWILTGIGIWWQHLICFILILIGCILKTKGK